MRAELNLNEGDQVEFETKSPGKIVLRKLQASGSSAGCAVQFIRKKKRLSLQEIKDAAAEGAVESYNRSIQ